MNAEKSKAVVFLLSTLSVVALVFIAFGLFTLFSSSPPTAQEIAQIEQNKKVLVNLKTDDLVVFCDKLTAECDQIYHVPVDSLRENYVLEDWNHQMYPEHMANVMVSSGRLRMFKISEGQPMYMDALKAYAFHGEIPQLLTTK